MQIRDVILSLHQQGKTVFFSSHELSEAEMICDRVAVLKQGILSWCGPTEAVAGDGKGNLERAFLSIISSAGEGQLPAGKEG
jgi:ABC-2 type transport system ATP-binding protein